MLKINSRHIFVTIIVLFLLTACTLPGFSTPTPFSFPTPDKTMTALFQPTLAVPATSAADGDGLSPEDIQKTADAEKPTNTPEPTESDETPTPTVKATETEDPDDQFSGPDVRPGKSVKADYINKKLNMDGDLYEWPTPIQKIINYVVYGAANHSGENDASGTVVAGWDEDYLYIGVRVKDDKYVQNGSGEQIYLGDSIEILFDSNVSGDFAYHGMNDDDYQIGISPGKYGIVTTIGSGKLALITGDTPTPAPSSGAKPPKAWMWFPKAEAGKKEEIKIGALETGQGYQVEFKIPWTLLDVTNPSVGDHFGFAISINDNDKGGELLQQTVVSNVPTRFYSDPTTWGDLTLQ
jgi:hypothetical protein